MATRGATAAGAARAGQRRALWRRCARPARSPGFSLRALAATPGAWRYFAEVLRQCSMLILGSTLVLLGMQAVIGGECGLFFVYLTRPLGATAAVGLLAVPCSLRELFPYMFGYIFAAKVGCGLVAEIGSMRISEEIDALESVGIDPMQYVVGTRLLAVLLCVPLIYICSMVTGLVRRLAGDRRSRSPSFRGRSTTTATGPARRFRTTSSRSSRGSRSRSGSRWRPCTTATRPGAGPSAWATPWRGR